MEYLTFIIKFIIIGLIYLILIRIIRIIYIDLKGVDVREIDESLQRFALEVIDSPDSLSLSIGSVYPLRDETKVGRNKSNDIVINDPFVSSRHVKLFIKDERLFAEDLKSLNGTLLNDTKLSKVQELSNNDELKIGRVLFKVIG